MWDWFIGIMPDWVLNLSWSDHLDGAIETGVVTFVTGLAGCWFIARRNRKNAIPAIDCAVSRFEPFDDLWRIDLAIGNNSRHRITVTCIDLVSPQQGRLFDWNSLYESDGTGGQKLLKKLDTEAGLLRLAVETRIAPSGKAQLTVEYEIHRDDFQQAEDRETTTVFLHLPVERASAELKLDVTIKRHGQAETFHKYPVRVSVGG